MPSLVKRSVRSNVSNRDIPFVSKLWLRWTVGIGKGKSIIKKYVVIIANQNTIKIHKDEGNKWNDTKQGHGQFLILQCEWKVKTMLYFTLANIQW